MLIYPAPFEAGEETVALTKWLAAAEGREHPVVAAAVAHYNLARAHPFGDGNGRVARLLMNAVLLRAGIMPCIIEPGEKKEYVEALWEADHRRTLSPLVRLMCTGIRRAMEEARPHGETKSE
jgi:Fic family protein